MADDINVELEELGKFVRGASTDFQNLAGIVRVFGRANPLKDTFLVSLKQARQLLKESGNNVEAVKAALKGAGVSGRDLSHIMRQLNSDVDKARRAAMGFEGIWQKIFSPRTVAYAAHAMQAVTGGFSILKTAMGGPLGMARDVVGRGIDLGKGLLDSVVEAAEFRQNALTGMSYMLGGDMEKARELFADAQKLAQETPLDTDKVIRGIKTFLTQGFTANQSKFLYRVVADQASKFLDEPEVEKATIEAFSRLQGRGYATGEDIESFRVAKFQGKGIFQQLLMQPGMKELMTGKNKLTGKETEEQVFKKLKTVLGTGLVGKGTLMNAVVGSMYEGQNLETGPGALAKKFGSESLTGALSNAKNAFGDMLKSMDLVNTKGFQALMKVLGDYAAMLTSAEGPGKRLRETVTGLVDAMLGGLANIKPRDMERMINTIGTLGQRAIGFLKDAWSWLDRLMHAEPGELFTNIKDVLMNVGKYIGMGLWQGVKFAAVEGTKEGLKTLSGFSNAQYMEKYGVSAETLAELAKQRGVSIEDFAPKFAEARAAYDASGQGSFFNRGTFSYGENIAATIPQFGEGAHVTGPTVALIGEKGDEYVVPGNKMRRMMGGGGVQISVSCPIYYAGGADEDSLYAAMEPVAMRAFRNAWERLSMEVG